MVRSRRSLIRSVVAIGLLTLATVLLITALGFGFKGGEIRLNGNENETVNRLGHAQAFTFVLFGAMACVLAWLVLRFGWLSWQRPPMAIQFLMILALVLVACVLLAFAEMALSIAGALNWLEPVFHAVESLILSVAAPAPE